MSIRPDRQSGYYWVLFRGEWVVGFWDEEDPDGSFADDWSIIGSDSLFSDEDFEEIGERIPDRA